MRPAERLSWTSEVASSGSRDLFHVRPGHGHPRQAGPSPDEEVRVSDETPQPSVPESVPAAVLPEPPNGVEYDASAIQVLEGLEAVRKRPGMYIGSTGERGLHHLIWEIVDNAVDEALAGYCDRVVVTLLADGGVQVDDNGRGIPTDTAPGQELPAVTTVLTMLHAGGKFGGGGYKVSGGLHGVGVSVVNALSSRLVVDVKNRGHLWRQTFTVGVPDGELEDVRSSSRANAPARRSPTGPHPTSSRRRRTPSRRSPPGSASTPSSTRASRSSSATSARRLSRSSRRSRTTRSPTRSTSPRRTASTRPRPAGSSRRSATTGVSSTSSSTSTSARPWPTRQSSRSRPSRARAPRAAART